MNKINLVILVFLVVPLALLIVSYSSYWYADKYDNGSKTYFKYNQIKIVNGDSNAVIEWDNDDHTHDIYRAALAFSVLAWIVNVVTMVFVVLGILGVLKKIPLLPTITKFLPIVVFVFCFISLFIFLGLPKAMDKDCKDYYQPKCSTERVDDLIGSDDLGKWGPVAGWACVIVSAGFSLFASILSVLFGNFAE